jgi:large subunit ribosomal protein L24
MSTHVKKGDTVEVISGAHKGVTGRILRVDTSSAKVVVEGVNRRYKHVKPSRKYPQGGRVQVEQPIHISNVLPVSPKSSKGTRVRFVTEGEEKKRVSKDGASIGVIRRAKKQ